MNLKTFGWHLSSHLELTEENIKRAEMANQPSKNMWMEMEVNIKNTQQ